MADVQVERGHIRIANKLFRAAVLAKLSPVEVRALMECLWRQYGWSNGGAPAPFRLGGSGLAQSIGGSRSTASQAITTLVDAGIIKETGDADDRGRRDFLVVKDYERWTCGFHRNPGRVHWTPSGGEVSPFRDTSVPVSRRTRSGFETLTTQEAQPVAASSEPLEPRENQEENQVPPKPPKGGGQFSLDIEAAPKPDPVLEVLAGYMEGRSASARPDDDGDFRVKVEARLARKGKGRSKVKGPECTAQDLIDLSRWVLTSPSRDAVLLREGGHDGYGTIYKPTRMEERLISMRAWRDEGAVKGTPSKAVAPTEADGSARLSYQSWSWFEGELSTRARERQMAPEQVCAAWARQHKEASNVPPWAFERAVANVRKERT